MEASVASALHVRVGGINIVAVSCKITFGASMGAFSMGMTILLREAVAAESHAAMASASATTTTTCIWCVFRGKFRLKSINGRGKDIHLGSHLLDLLG